MVELVDPAGICLRLKPPPVNLAWSADRCDWMAGMPAAASSLSCSLHTTQYITELEAIRYLKP